MGVNRFEDLRVWQAAQRQCDRVGELMKRPEFRRDAELTGQMNDASISVTLNISEGFLRRRDKETMQFLRYSISSNGELKACFYIARGRRYLDPEETTELIDLNESIAKMLRRWQGTLEESGTLIRGRAKTGARTKDQGPRRTDQGPRTEDGPRTKNEEPGTN
jgi:four helix bundle protein